MKKRIFATTNIDVIMKGLIMVLVTLAAVLSFGTTKVCAAEIPTSKQTPLALEEDRRKPMPVPTPAPQPTLAQTAELIAFPIPTDADHKNDPQVVGDYVNDVPIPVVMNYMGNWFDQFGNKMYYKDARDYLKEHPGYCYVVKSINIQLEDLMSGMRKSDLAAIPDGEADGSYSFINRTINKLRDNGTYIVNFMSPYRVETLQAYLDWAKKEDNSIPVYKSDKNGWVDQYKQPTTNTEVFQCCPDYQDAVEAFAKYAKKSGLSDAMAIDEAQSIYCAWYMESARYERGVSNDMIYGNATSMEDSSYILDEYWSLERLAEEFQQSSAHYHSVSSVDYTDDAIRQLKDTDNWCDACYAMYQYDSELAPVHANVIYSPTEEVIGYIRNEERNLIEGHAARYCSEGHLCGYYDEDTHTYVHMGLFYWSVVNKREELNK